MSSEVLSKIFTIPIVYGSIATPLPADDERRIKTQHSHQWTVYFRSAEGKDISWLFDKIQITLHESFTNPKRMLTEPPYEVSETGWGEFEVLIKLYMWQNTEKAVTLHHNLKLFHPLPPGADPTASPIETSPDPVISEKYDELVFTEPLDNLYERYLQNKDKVDPNSHNHPFDKQYELKEISLILEGLNKVKDQVSFWREKHDKLKEEVAIFRQNKKSGSTMPVSASAELLHSAIGSPQQQPSVVDDDSDAVTETTIAEHSHTDKRKRKSNKEHVGSVKKKIRKSTIGSNSNVTHE